MSSSFPISSLKTVAWICLLLQLFSITSISYGSVHSATDMPAVADTEIAGWHSQPYVLREGETPASVASVFGLTLSQLQTFNQLRTFRVPFPQLGPGDEIDVPAKSTLKGNTSINQDSAGQRDMHVASRLQDMNSIQALTRSSDAASGMARSMASGAASNAVQEWMSRFGSAQVNLSVDEKGSLTNSALDWLVPVYDTPENLLFAQTGARNKDDRNTVNLGWGWRTFTSDWMFGINNFYDNDLTGNNHRAGVGIEARTNYLQLAGNTYFRLNNWHQSRDFSDYDERPANGFDIRTQGWLPAYPQLGGKLVYEQYYGDNVALFGKDNLQSNPYAVTAGIDWTPFPLLTAGIDHRMGKGGQKENNINLQLNWRFGEPLSSQLASENVSSMRLLESSRYDMVDRNNNIILEYRKQTLISQSLSATTISGPGGSQHPLNISVNAKYGVKTVSVAGDNFISAGGSVASQDTTRFILTLPPYQAQQQALKAKRSENGSATTDNIYVLSVTSEDYKGNVSPSDYVTVKVLPPELSVDGELQVLNDYAPADNTSAITVRSRVTDSSGNPVAEQQVTFTTVFADGSTVTRTAVTDVQGLASVDISSSVAGEATVTMTAGMSSKSTPVHFVADAATAGISALEILNNGAVADGVATNRVQVLVSDASGNPVTGAEVTFTATNGTTVAATGTTGADGSVIVTLTSTVAGDSTVTASHGGSVRAAVVTFVGNAATAGVSTLTVVGNNAAASGTASISVQASVTDVNGNPVAGVEVSFTATNGASVPVTGITGADGTVTVTVTSTVAGASTVTASLNGSTQSAELTFVADAATARVSALELLDDGAVADDMAINRVRASVIDTSGNPVPGIEVMFTATNGATVPATGTTGADGSVTVTLTSTVAGISTVTATHGGSSQSADVTFVGDAATARMSALTVVTNNAAASGTATNSVRAVVIDAGSNPVSGAVVTFSATNGATIAATGTTGADGSVTVTLTSTVAGLSTVTATHNGSSHSADVTFVADTATAWVTGLDLLDDGALANGTATNRVRAFVADADGNPVPGAVVNFTATNGATVAATGTTGADGSVTVTLTSTVAGTSTVTALHNGSSQSASVNFVADTITARMSALDVVTNNAAASGTATNSVRAVVSDAHGNPVPGASVAFSATNDATIIARDTTGADGSVTVTLTSTRAGASTVTATHNGSTQTADVAFVADAATALVSGLELLDDGAVANDIATNRVQAFIRDASGNPVSGTVVTFSATNSATVAASGTTGADGSVTVTLTSTVAGVSTVTAALNGSSHSTDVTFIANATTAGVTALEVADNGAVANDTATNRVQAFVADAYGNPVSGAQVAFTATNGATVAATGTTGAEGSVTVTLTSIVAGASTVTASLNGSSQTADVTFVGDPDTAGVSALTVVNNNAIASGTASNRVRALVSDTHGNPVSGAVVTFTASNGATVPATGTTGADGTVTVTLTSTVAGASTVTATHNGSTQTTGVTFVANAATARVSALTIVSNNAGANGAAINSVRALVTDAHSNPVHGADVAFAATNGASVVATGNTGVDGSVTVTLTSTIAGTSTVTATHGGSTQSVVVTFVADADTARVSALTVVSNNAVVSGTATNSVRAVVLDAGSNPVSGAVVTFSATNGATIAATGTTGADGSVTVTLTSTVAGISTVTATHNGSSHSADVTFVADAATAGVSALTVVNNNAVASGTASNSVRAVVSDADGNPVPGAVVNFTATNGATVAATGTTGADGSVTVTLTSTVAGVSTVTASHNGSSRTAAVVFVADAITARMSALDVVTNNAAASGTATNSVRAVVSDAHGNPVPGASVAFSASNSATVTARGTTGEDGSVTVTLTSTRAGASTVTATHNGSTQTADVAFVADAVTAGIRVLTVVSNNAVADGAASNSVRALVSDAHDNPIPGGVVMFSATNGATVPATGTTGADGSVTVTLTSTRAGASTVTAALNDSSQTAGVNFVADEATAGITALEVADNGAVANDAAANRVRAFVADAYGNPVSGAEVTFSATNGATIAATGTTGADGNVTVTLTSTVAGISTVTATHNGSSHSTDVTFVGDPDTAGMSTLTVLNNNVVASGTAAISVQASVTDVNGNPVAGAVVNFTATNGATVPVTATTGADGTVTVTLTSTVAGDSTVTASLNGSTQSADVTFVADAASARVAGLTVVNNNAIATGTASNRVRAVVSDASGNPVSGAVVTFSATNSAVIAATGTTGANGSVIVTLTSTVAGVSTVTASHNGSTQSADVTFVGDPATARMSALTVGTNNAAASGTATNSVRAVVSDVRGNPVSKASVAFSASNGATITARGTTGADGSVTVTLTSTRAGASTVTATHNGSTLTTGVTFVGDTATARVSALTVVSNNAVASGTASNSVRAAVTDVNANPVPGAVVNFTATNSAVIAATGTTGADGSVTVNLTSTVAGVSTVTAAINDSSQGVNTTFIPGEADASRSVLNASPMRIEANNTAMSTLVLTLRDAHGNAVGGQSGNMILRSSLPGTVLHGAVSESGAGVYTQTLSGTGVGITTITAELSGLAFSVAPVNVELAPGTPVTANSTLTASKNSIEGNGTDSTVLTLALKDLNNHPVPGRTVVFSSSLAGTRLTTPADLGNGSYTSTMTGTTAGAATITVTVDGMAFTVPLTITVTTPPPVAFPAGTYLHTHLNPYGINMSSGFPKTGFSSATFTVYLGGSTATNGNYTWRSNQSWVSVSTTGVVTFSSMPTSATRTVTITATPNSGGQTYSYTFTVSKWFIPVPGATKSSAAQQDINCQSNYGTRLATLEELTNQTIPTNIAGNPASGTRDGSGTSLWPNWGPMYRYPAGTIYNGSYWTAYNYPGTTPNLRPIVMIDKGTFTHTVNTVGGYGLCMIQL